MGNTRQFFTFEQHLITKWGTIATYGRVAKGAYQRWVLKKHQRHQHLTLWQKYLTHNHQVDQEHQCNICLKLGYSWSLFWMLGLSKRWKSNKYQLLQPVVQTLPWSTESYLLSRISTSASSLLTASTFSCDVQKAKNLNVSLGLLNQHLIKASSHQSHWALLVCFISNFSTKSSELHVVLSLNTNLLLEDCENTRTLSLKRWFDGMQQCQGAWKRRSSRHHFNIHGYVAGNSAANTICCPGIDLFKKGIPSTKLAGCDDTVLQWCWGVFFPHLSHCFGRFGGGEAKISESS